MRLVEDRQLLDRFRAGDQDAMTAVFRTYSDDLARYLRGGFSFQSGAERLRFRGIDNRHDLHDILAETFRNAFEERARLAYGGLSPYNSYLRAIARNLVIDKLRSKTSAWLPLEGEVAAEAEAAQGTQASPEDQLQQGEVAGLVAAFVATLTDDHRTFVRLRFQEGLSQRDVARHLGTTRRSVRAQEVTVRKLLLRHMKRTGYLPPAAGSEVNDGL